MSDTIRAHDYQDGKCVHCGDREAENTGEHAARSCVARELPRATPSSIFSSLGDIGEEMRRIRREEGREVAEPPDGI